MRNLKYIFSVVLMLSLFSCEDFFATTLTVDPPEHVESLVVNAFGNTRTNELEVSVSKSVGLLSNTWDSDLLINDATVELIKDGTTYTLIPIPNTQSEFNYLLEAGNLIYEKGETYQIKVNAPGFDEATASATVPNDVQLSTIVFDPTVTNFGDGDEYKAINTIFNDPENEDNYYECGGLISRELFGVPGFDMFYLEFLDPIVEYGIFNLLFKDDSFNGLEKNVKFYVSKWQIDENPGIEEYLYLNWRVISSDHYNYSRSVNTQYENDGNPFASPVQVFSNIEGGFGIFSIYNEQYLKVN